MEAITLPVLLSTLGSVVSGAFGFMQMQQSAALQEMNASIADQNAQRAQERSQIEQEEQDRLSRGMIGEQIAAQAASGMDIGRGSPVRTRMSARELARKDALNIRQAGEIEAYNYRAQAAGMRAQANIDRIGGAGGLLGSFLSAGSTITNAKPVAQRNYYNPVPLPRQRVLS